MRTLRRQRPLLVLAAGGALSAVAFVAPSVSGVGADEGIATPTVCASTPLLSTDASKTNWTTTIALPKFDPALGTLESVSITGTLKVEGIGRAESRDAQPATVTAKISVAGTLGVPSAPPQTVTPEISRSFSATAWDGLTDFGGTSGFTTDSLNTFQTFAPITLTGADMASFVGVGTWSSSAAAVGKSSASGAGNLTAEFDTKAQADVCVVYAYTPTPTTTTSTTIAPTSTTSTTSTTIAPTTVAPTTSTTTTLVQSGGPTSPPTTADTPNGELPATGRSSASIAWTAAWLVALGTGLVVFVRRRRTA